MQTSALIRGERNLDTLDLDSIESQLSELLTQENTEYQAKSAKYGCTGKYVLVVVVLRAGGTSSGLSLLL